MERVSVRYIVSDVDEAIDFYTVDEAIDFYTEKLGFEVEMHPAPAFASLARGPLRLLLNRPGSGGAGQSMPDGEAPEPGGWNRIQIEVDDLDSTYEQLRDSGARFRNEIVIGIGGKQVLLQDPSGNLVELFQPA